MKLRVLSMLACGCALVLGSAEPALARNEVPSVTVREDQRVAIVWIYPDCPVMISYRTENASAKAGKDYRAVTGRTLTAEGGTRPRGQAFQIPLLNDRIKERTETLRIIVDITTQEVWFGVGAAGCSPGTPTFQTIEATLTIVDND